MDIGNLTINELIDMRKDIKILAIKTLIEAISNDAVRDAVSHFETQKEQDSYLEFIKN